MKKYLKLLLIVVIITTTLTNIVFAENITSVYSNEIYYEELVHLGVLNEYAVNLDSEVTRLEGMMVIYRLINNAEVTEDEKQILEKYKVSVDESNKYINRTPFTDVPEWAIDEINFLYEEGIINGVSDTELGIDNELTTNDFITLLLRVMGYRENDFKWDEAIEMAVVFGLISPRDFLSLKEIEFNKGVMNYILYSCIEIK